MDNTLVQRMIGAAKLDVHTYEEVERDKSATQQALIVVILAAVAGGIGALGSDDAGAGLIGGVISSVFGWAVFAAAVYFVGTRFTAGAQTQADWGQVARATGFAYTPSILSIFGFIPIVGAILGLVGLVWFLAASVVAIRQSLDFSTGRAIITALGAGVALLVVLLVVGLVLGGTAAAFRTAGTNPIAPRTGALACSGSGLYCATGTKTLQVRDRRRAIPCQGMAHPDMGRYIRRISSYGREIKLFLLFNMLVYIGVGVFTLVFNLYLYALDLREDYIGAFSAVQTLAMATAALTMGRLLTRFGTWRCILVATGGYLVVSLGLAITEHPAILLVLAALLGVTLAYLFTTTMPFIIEWGRRDQRQDIATLGFSLISLSTTFGSLLGGIAPSLAARGIPGVASESAAAYRWTLIAGTVVTCFAVLPLLRMTEARRRSPKTDVATARAVETPADRKRVRRDTTVFVAMGGIMSLGAGMVFPFYNVYLSSLGASAGEVGLVYAAGGLAAAVIGLSAPAVSRRFGSIWAVFWVRLSIAPFYLLLILTPNIGLAVITHLVRQTSISMAWPIDSTFISEVLPPRARASVFGYRSGTWNLGWSVASLVGGWIIVQSGYEWTFFSLVFFTALAVIVFVVYYERHPLIRAGHIPSALPPRRRLSAPESDADAPALPPEEGGAPRTRVA